MVLLRRQLKSALISWKWLVVAVVTVIILALQYRTAFFTPWVLPQPNPNFFNYMLLFNYFGSGTKMYLLMIPILASFVGGDLYSRERVSGRLNSLLMRVPQRSTLRISLLSSFIIGGLAGIFPLFVSMVIAIIHRPHMWFVEGVLNSYNYPLIDADSWVYGLYKYNQLLLLAFAYVYIYVMAGLMSAMATGVTFFTHIPYVEILAPFAFAYIPWVLVSLASWPIQGLSYMNFLDFRVATRPPNELGAAMTIPILFLITALLYGQKVHSDVI